LGEGLSSTDGAAFAVYQTRMRRYAAALAPMLSRAPPRLGTSHWPDRFALLNMAWQVRKLGRRDMRDLLRIGGMNVYDPAAGSISKSDALKGALGLDAVLGSELWSAFPRHGIDPVVSIGRRGMPPVLPRAAPHSPSPTGGMGALCDALAKAPARPAP